MRPLASIVVRPLLACALLALGACAWQGQQEVDEMPVAEVTRGPDPRAPKLTVLPTRYFPNVAADDEILGDIQILFTRPENTFADLARHHDLGYDEVRIANPNVDAWLPGDATPVYLPTMQLIPPVERDGVVVNLPSMRLMYFRALESGEGTSVSSYPIGIGREGWATPTGTAKIIQKTRNPKWHPPASVRAEHAALGDPLPAVVPPGPDNPLGLFKMRLSLPGYLIHGTNKPAGVGMRVSHGCIRLYPEDIETLFERVPMQTPVHLVNQPVLAGWRGGKLYLEVHPPLAEDERDITLDAALVLEAAILRAGLDDLDLNLDAIATIVSEQRGIPFPVTGHDGTLEQYLVGSRIIRNLVPLPQRKETASR